MKKSSTVMFSSLVLASSLFITACNDDSNAENVAELAQYSQQGKTYLEQSQFKAAINSASNAVLLYPDHQDGYVILAKVYNKLGQSNQALEVLNRYQGQKDADFYLLLLESYQRTKKVISANKLIEQQSELLSSKGNSFKLLQAKLLLLENKPEQALLSFTELQQQAGFESDGFIGEARIAAGNNDKEAALALLEKAIMNEPKNTEALMLKGFLLLEKGQIEQAESTLSFALSELPSSDIFTPERINILKALTSILTSQGRSSEALLYSRILSDEFPTATTINEYYVSAQEYYKRKQLGEAKEALQKILEIDPKNKKASTMLGVILYTEGDINGAEKYLSGMIDPEVNTPQLTQIYAMTQLKLNQSHDVLDILDGVIEYEERLDTLTLYAIAAIAEKQFDKADIAIARIKKLFPDSPKLTLIESSYLNEKSPDKEQEVLDLLAAGLAKNSSDLSLQTVYLKKLIAMQRLEEADRFIANEVNKPGEAVGTRLLIANYYLYRNQYALAEQSFNQTLKISDNVQAYYGLAQSKQLQQDWSSAFTYYNQIIDLYPEQIKAYYGAVISTQQQNKDPLNMEESLSNKHNPSVLALVLADYQFQKKQFSQADKMIKKAVNLPVELVDKGDTLQQQISNQRIIAAIRSKDYTSARELTLAQLQLTPTKPIFLMRLAAIETLSGQYAEADKVLKQVEVILPHNPQVVVLKAQLAMTQKDDTTAIQLLTDEWNKNNNDEIAVELYKIYQQSDKSKAEAFLSKWLVAAPSSLYANLNNGMLLQAKGENEAAIQAYEKVLSVSPNELRSLNNAAWLYSLEKNPKAEVLAAKAYEVAPNNPAVLDTYGWILHQSGKTAEARPLIKKALTLLPDNVEIQKHWQEVSE
ncbi:tetratricopeptide repeat protein [Psychromonas sp.]|uniref:tetratricopeptide repeat protein n=1 Tax=Psychromonas sp. TaxID=1884585 RepID=UPI003A96B3D4